ncbi:MAG TPA: SpoIIE family protein phosphatase [Candidatus Polarisedimenticolia bacterium]|nr:SpoIIE family protein phosphatase [Candidatus Polarisedimenticolia bacterium]
MKSLTMEWATAARTLRGETESGDRHLVTTWPGGAILAAADGLGHGAEAALAARLALGTVERCARQPLTEIVERCHETLRQTRGVAMSLARWEAHDQSLSWMGVGNVEGLLVCGAGESRKRYERLLLRSGAVGIRMPPLLSSTVTVPAGSLLIFVTDGIADSFDQGLDRLGRPQMVADRILASHSLGTDDALVLVARFSE